MKAKDLMIGDWIQIGEIIFKIVDLDAPHGEVHSERWVYDLERCNPIPLTPEILEKNGFEECFIEEIEYYGWRLNEDFSLERNAIDTLIWNDNVSIHYVHELQHALRLCKIEKEIIL